MIILKKLNSKLLFNNGSFLRKQNMSKWVKMSYELLIEWQERRSKKKRSKINIFRQERSFLNHRINGKLIIFKRKSWQTFLTDFSQRALKARSFTIVKNCQWSKKKVSSLITILMRKSNRMVNHKKLAWNQCFNQKIIGERLWAFWNRWKQNFQGKLLQDRLKLNPLRLPTIFGLFLFGQWQKDQWWFDFWLNIKERRKIRNYFRSNWYRSQVF